MTDTLRFDIQIIILDMQLQVQDPFQSHNALEVATDKLQRLISQEAARLADERLINELQALIDRSYHPKREVHDITAIGMGVFDLLAAITAEIAALTGGKDATT